ncbi:MAG: bifunctional glutamate N-acetyltransferase/amino-acid acetyltransferase ArgJ [Nitrospirae bacterium]|nr:MAG: bifunctional glutamate N-acetyltransferase/amino-acid acetyltransferase ArgJ [Nitrospirota bacterium]
MTLLRRPGGITAPQGFCAAGIHAGIKASGALDLALVVSTIQGTMAGLFTRNRLPAAPVVVNRQKLRTRLGQAIIINSGNANACTGPQGLQQAKAMAKVTAQHLGLPVGSVYVGSTGIIGQPLPIEKISRAIPLLVQRLRRAGHTEAARAIMTTDTVPKEAAFQTTIGDCLVTVGGMAKGAGMIHPDMATMLAYLTTDAAIEPGLLQHMLTQAVRQSFNCISIDGETSTNDMVLCLANGLAGNPILREGMSDCATFQQALTATCETLALKIVQDGEGATKVAHIVVKGARTSLEAKRVANTIATSPLVKTAFFGEDPNWGRIAAAIGRARARISPRQFHIWVNQVALVRNGIGVGPSAERQARRIMKRRQFTITVEIGPGSGMHHCWTTDFSYEYVKINAAYHT